MDGTFEPLPDAMSPTEPPTPAVPVCTWTAVAPQHERLAPSQAAVGDELQFFGHDFIPADCGTLSVELDGTYVATDGGRTAFRHTFTLEVSNASVAELAFEELYFSPVAGELGTFVGTAVLTNELTVPTETHAAGSQLTSAPANVSLEVLPSIDVIEFRATDSDDGNCANVTAATQAGAALALNLRTIGFGEATPENPIRFRIGFVSPQIQAQFVKKDVYPRWPPIPTLPVIGVIEGADDLVADAATGQNTMTIAIENGSGVTLDPTRQATEMQVNPPVQVGAEQHADVYLARLVAGPAEEGNPGPVRARIQVEAEGNGFIARRTLEMDIWAPWEIMPYNQNQRLVEIYEPEVPSGACGSCVSGGFNGREVTYTEGESISRDRRVSLRWDMSVAESLGLNLAIRPSFPAQYGADLNANSTWTSAFGVDVSTGVTTESHRGGSYQAFVLPTFYALCYRQLSRYEREVDVVYHNACGSSGVVGSAVMTDWGWGFDVAQGETCPPSTTLPPAQLFE